MIKAKRKLSDISFEKEGAHVALVSKQQGGGANNRNYALVLKGHNFSEEYIQKMQQVKVTMELPDFLQRFFNVYYDDAEVLARMMGYTPPVKEEGDSWNYEDYIQSKLEAFEVLKSVHDAESIAEVLSGLDETQYLSMLNDQSLVEKAFRKMDKEEQTKEQTVAKATETPVVKPTEKESEVVAKAADEDTSTHASVEKSIEASASVNPIHKEQNMTKEIKVDDTTKIEKSATELSLELLQKSFDESRVELQKAQELIAEFKKEKQEQIQKSKTAQFTAVIKDEKLQAPIVKAALSLESEDDFVAFLAAITSMQTNIETTQGFIEKSALFQEQGASTSEEPKDKESAVARILKSKQVK